MFAPELATSYFSQTCAQRQCQFQILLVSPPNQEGQAPSHCGHMGWGKAQKEEQGPPPLEGVSLRMSHSVRLPSGVGSMASRRGWGSMEPKGRNFHCDPGNVFLSGHIGMHLVSEVENDRREMHQGTSLPPICRCGTQEIHGTHRPQEITFLALSQVAWLNRSGC